MPSRTDDQPRRLVLVLVLVLVLAVLALAGCNDAVTPPDEPEEPAGPPAGAEVVWPLANTDEPDADSVSFPFGPRALNRGYDYHAGIDLPASIGTSVYSVLPGRVVLVSEWDGESTGPGNAVLVAHSGDRSTSYLHLHEIGVSEGDSLELGDELGTVGRTGASTPHLHLGYFVGLPRDTRVRDERESRNPLELLPHDRPDTMRASFTEDGVTLDVPLRRMTVRRIALHGPDERRTLDYYSIVQRGFNPRKEQVQSGVHIDVGRPDAGRFELPLTPRAFTPTRVTVTDIHGDVILDERRPTDSSSSSPDPTEP